VPIRSCDIPPGGLTQIAMEAGVVRHDLAKLCLSVKPPPGVQSDCQSPVWLWVSKAFEGGKTRRDLGDYNAEK